MCLAVPGKILSIDDQNGELMKIGRVSFGGIVKDVNLAYTPEAKIGDYVIVHVGFALNTVDEAEADKVFEYLKEIDDLDELSGEEKQQRRKGNLRQMKFIDEYRDAEAARRYSERSRILQLNRGKSWKSAAGKLMPLSNSE